MKYRQTDNQIYGQTDGQTDTQTDRKTDRQTHRQTDGGTNRIIKKVQQYGNKKLGMMVAKNRSKRYTTHTDPCCRL